MDKKVKNLLKKMNDISSLVIDNLNDLNIDSINSVVSDFERKILMVIRPPGREGKKRTNKNH